jgi:hypothetical protein
MPASRRFLALLPCSLLAALVACGAAERRSVVEDDGGPSGTAPAPSGPAGSFGDASADGPSGDACRKMDIVFVIDNSFTMEEEQENLRKNYPRFVNVLDAFKTKTGESIDYRLAVTSTDSDRDKGAFRTNGGGRAWLERGDGAVADTFARRATLGTGGSSYERPLESLRLALTDRITDGTNGTFTRPDALLAFVVVTDEDEGGAIENRPARPVVDYLTFFDSLAGNRARWATALIAGLGPGRCTSAFGEAYEATRLVDFVARAGKNAVASSICEPDLAAGLEKALRTFELACASFAPR